MSSERGHHAYISNVFRLALQLVADNQSVSAGQAIYKIEAIASTGSTGNNSTNGNTPDLLTQDIINLLKALAYGDVSGAKTDLAKFKTDLKAESVSTNNLNNVAKDVSSLFKDRPRETAQRPKLTPTKSLWICRRRMPRTPQQPGAQPLENLVIKISDALSTGAVQSAVQDVAGYLVQHGQASGSLINLSA